MSSKEFPWHARPLGEIAQAMERGRLAHGLLLEGPEGLGKLALAFEIARRVLGMPATAGAQGLPPVHPDFLWVTLEEGEKGPKKQIGIDQVRVACAELAMTSYSGGWKVAVICPADRLTPAAANSLLKTLEEPASRTLIVLVRSRLDTLPATIASRCQRLRLNPPPEDVALDWLAATGGDRRRWARLLALAGGAPLLAVRLGEEGFEELDRELGRALPEIVAGRRDPLEVAAALKGREPAQVLMWLEHWVGRLVKLALGAGQGAAGGAEALQTVLQRIPLPRLFRYLDEIRAARVRTDGSLNPQLVIENLLTPWADALEPVTGAADEGVLADR